MSDDPGKADASVCCMEEGDEEAVEAMDCEDVDAAGWSWSPHAASVVHASIAPHIQSILFSLLSTASSGRIASRRHAHCGWCRERATQRIEITRVGFIK
jgi:hypothetical protein